MFFICRYNEGGHAAFADDIRLIFTNCCTYTPDPTSPYYQAAQSLLKYFEKEYTALCNPKTIAPSKIQVFNGDENELVWYECAVAAEMSVITRF